jgi:hypothetical protein
MIRLCIICEGPTEAEFVKTCLEPHLRKFNIVAYPSLLKTRPGKQGGGNVTIERVVKHLAHEYKSSDRISTLLDFYGFSHADGRTKPELEQAILTQAEKDIPNFDKRFVLPYVQRYEFEGLLFSEVEQFQWVMDGWNERAKAELQAVRSAFMNPEEINNSRVTAPSKRILAIFGNKYSKVLHGAMIAAEIGLPAIRAACPAFNDWVTALETMKISS